MCSRCVQYPVDQLQSILAIVESPSNIPQPIRADLIKIHQENEEPWKAVLDSLKTGNIVKPIGDQEGSIRKHYGINDQGILCMNGKDDFGTRPRVIVPKILVPLILYWNHDATNANHQGFERTLHKVQRDYYWPTIIKDTELYVKSCLKCQLSKASVPYFNSHFHPLKMVPEAPGEILCMDIAYMPRSSEGYQYFLVIVDLFSRFVEAYPLRDMTANEITKSITSYCCIHGFPVTIYTDNASAFKKALQDDCFHLLNIKHDVVIPWRHCSNISERYIRMLKDGIKILSPQNKLGWWSRYIKFVVYSLNTSLCRSIGMTPFEAYHSRAPGKTHHKVTYSSIKTSIPAQMTGSRSLETTSKFFLRKRRTGI